MITPPILDNELQRQAAVEKYKLLDTMPEESYDSITFIISTICDAPISLITLVDKNRIFLKSRNGIDLSESPRDTSFCGHAIAGNDDVMIVPDARKDKRFKGNPIVDNFKAIFYAGAPLIDKNGYKLGTLCVYDHRPKTLTENQINALKAMAKQVMSLFEERFKTFELQQLKAQVDLRNQELKDFAGIVSHDLKAPLSNIIMISELLRKGEKNLSQQSNEYLGYLKESSNSMSRYIDGMLQFYRSEELVSEDYDEVSYVDLMEEVIALTVLNESVQVRYVPEKDTTLITNHIALKQILVNLISNAIKYSDKKHTKIDVQLIKHQAEYELSVRDNGSGIPPEKINSVFKLFYVGAKQDRNGKQGTGIGLATVSRLLEHMNGSITVDSKLGKWTEFKIHLPIKGTTNFPAFKTPEN